MPKLRSVASGTGTTTTFTATKPTGLAVGDVMKCSINNTSANSGWARTGWTAFVVSGGFGTALWKIADATDVAASNFAFTGTSAGTSTGGIEAWLQCDSTTPVADMQAQRNGSSTSQTGPSATATRDGSILSSDVVLSAALQTTTVPAGFTKANDVSAGGRRVSSAWKLVPTGATGTYTWTLGSAALADVYSFILNPPVCTVLRVSATWTAATALTVNATKPVGLAVGDLMVADYGCNNSTSFGVPSGWTKSITDLSNGGTARKIATSGDVAASTFAFTNNTGLATMGVAITAYAAGTFDATTPIDVVNLASTAAANPSSASLTVTNAGSLAHGSCIATVSTSATSVGHPGMETFNASNTSMSHSNASMPVNAGATGTWDWVAAATTTYVHAITIINGATGTQTILPSGIASGETFGTAVVTRGAVTVSPSGIASTNAFGTAVVTTGSVTVSPSGIATTVAFGGPTVSPGSVTLSPGGVAPTAAFGTAVVTPGAVTVSPSGIAPTIAFGTALFESTITVTGIASTVGFGTPVVTVGAVTITPTGIAAAAVFGTPVVTTGPVTVSPSGIAPTSGVGTPALTPGAIIFYPSGIDNSAAFGLPLVELDNADKTIIPAGIAPTVTFGDATFTYGAVAVYPVGIGPTVTFGVPKVKNVGGFVPEKGETLTHSMNRLAGTLVGGVPSRTATGAANIWAGTSGLELVAALNVKAGNAFADYVDLARVLNQIAGTDDLDAAGAAAAIEA